MGITLDLTAMIIVTFCLVLFSAVPSLQGAPGGGDPDLDLESFYRGLHICLQPMFSAYVGYYGYDAAEKLALEMIDYEIYPFITQIITNYKFIVMVMFCLTCTVCTVL